MAVEGATAPADTTAAEVTQGSIVKAVFVEMWVKSKAATGTSTQYNAAIEIRPSAAPAMTNTNILNLGSYLNKKNVLIAQQANLGDLNTQSIPVFRQWIKIPRGKQRIGLGDKFVINMAAGGAAIDVCGLFVYKEYR